MSPPNSESDESSITKSNQWLPWPSYAAPGYALSRLPQSSDEVLKYVLGSSRARRFDVLNPARFVALAALLHYGVDIHAVIGVRNRISASQWLHEELGVDKRARDVTQDDIERVQEHIRHRHPAVCSRSVAPPSVAVQQTLFDL